MNDPAVIRGMTTRAFLRQHGISVLQLPLLAKEYLVATRNRMEEIRLFQGLPEILRSLKISGCRQGVLSSNSAENIDACLRANGVEDVFDFVIGYPRFYGKGRAIRRLLKKEIAREQFLCIGDEIRDVEAARQAGVDIAAVAWGFHTKRSMSAESPTYPGLALQMCCRP